MAALGMTQVSRPRPLAMKPGGVSAVLVHCEARCFENVRLTGWFHCVGSLRTRAPFKVRYLALPAKPFMYYAFCSDALSMGRSE